MNHFKGLIEHSIEPLRVCMIFIMFHRWGYLLQLDFKYRFVIIMIIITEFHLLRRFRRKATNKYASYHSNILDLWCTNDLQTLQAHIRVKHNNDCRGVLRFFSTRYATFTAFHEKRSMALHSVTWKNLWSVRRGCAFHVDYIPELLLTPNRQVWRQALWYFFPMYIPIINNPYTLHTRYVFYCENTLLIDSKVWLKNESHIFF